MQIIANDKTDRITITDLTWQDLFDITNGMILLSMSAKNPEAVQRSDKILDSLDFATETMIGKLESYDHQN